MYKSSTRWEKLRKKIKTAVQGHEESIFLVVGLLLVIGIPLVVMWNPISGKFQNEKEPEVLPATEIPDPDPISNPGGGNNSGNNNGGGSNGGSTRPTGKPDVRDDSITIPPGTPVTIRPLDNDRARDNVPIRRNTFRVAPDQMPEPDEGILEFLPNEQVRFTPSPNLPTDRESTIDVRYTVESENGQRDDAIMRFVVRPTGYPDLEPDIITTTENVPVTFNPLNNDKTRDNNSFIPGSIKFPNALPDGVIPGENGQPSPGRLTANPDGTVLFVPSIGFEGTVRTRYTVWTQNGLRRSDDLEIRVLPNPFGIPVNQPPVANNDTATTPSNEAVTIPVLNNDFNPNGDLPGNNTTVTLLDSGRPSNGTILVNPNGTITYTPNPGTQPGTDTFMYRITDDEGLTDEAQVTVNLTSPSITVPVPDARDDVATTPFDSSVTIPVTTNDVRGSTSIPIENVESITITTPPPSGSVVVNPNFEVVYNPNPGFSGTDTFTYTLTDDNGNTDIANVTVTVQPQPAPIIQDDTSSTPKNSPVTIPVLENDTAPGSELNTGSVGIITQPNNGSAIQNPDGTITYTPRDGFTGTDTFEYTVANSTSSPLTGIGTVTVTVIETDTPLAVNDSATTPRNTPVEIPILENDTEPNGEVTSSDFVRFPTQPNNGRVEIDEESGVVTYTPNNGYSGTDSFTYEITNGTNTSTGTVTVDVVNPAGPNALDDSTVTVTEVPVEIPVLTNDQTNGGANIKPDTLTVERQPENGTVTINTTTGVITYVPDDDFAGVDTFIYEIGNESGQFDTALVTINVVQPEESVPIVEDDNANTIEDTPIEIPITDNDNNPSGPIDPEKIEIIKQPENGETKVNPETGDVTFTPKPGFVGQDQFIYRITDDSGNSASGVVNIIVQPKPVQPTVTNPGTPANPDGKGSSNQSQVQPRQGQVLGAFESQEETPRTGGEEELLVGLLLGIGVLLSGSFFGSLYFMKAKTKK